MTFADIRNCLLAIVLLAGIAWMVVLVSNGALREEEERDPLVKQRGAINPAMVCPHCQVKGAIRTQQVQLKKGVSGGKATAAVLTGGWSLVATGLSRKEEATKAHCGNCNNTWVF